jgi:hypothetical protein
VSIAPTAARREELQRRGLWLEWFTVAWNVVEAVVAIGVGLAVGSVALVGFGVDSGIEVISAVALLWRHYRTGPNASAEEHGDAERKALYLVAATFSSWPPPFPTGLATASMMPCDKLRRINWRLIHRSL